VSDGIEYIAHVRRDENGNWANPHPLREHLMYTGEVAGRFASKFNSEMWGKLAGVAHDAGKGRETWQNYLRLKSGYFDEEAHLEGKPGKIPHAIYGAKLVEEIHGKEIGRVISYCIAGHHAGLQDWASSEGTGRASLEYQLARVEGLDEIEHFIRNAVKSTKPATTPWAFSGQGLDISLWIRMLYSCLVDADFLDTEAYMDQSRAQLRHGYCSIPELLERLNDYYDKLVTKSKKKNAPINDIRQKIRQRCVSMAKEKQGIFSLSVPTGGGKTLSSLAFALEHAKAHSMDRVIYVIPYTSIIEQNAEVFRKALGDDQVVEHHSSIIEEDLTPRLRLATENWDAPVIVTTSVQFFESLFSSSPSRCRKLHNIANSVVILDEAQLLPIEYLGPILETMQLLVDYYRVTIVICTATQPALSERIVEGHIFKGLKNTREIIGSEDEVRELYNSLKRVRVSFPDDLNKPSTWEEIAKQLVQHEQVLCVVSDRKSCRELHALMPEGTYHLSALMCGQHRSETIQEIIEKLERNETCRVISTQLVEAGVDLDFPVVYRAFAGLDSIAQAAGRCNREGRLPTLGEVIVFIPPKQPPPGLLRKAEQTTRDLLSTRDQVDPLDHRIYEHYFTQLYWKANSLDTKDIAALLRPTRSDLGIFFRTASERFQIIDSTRQRTVLVRYGKGNELIDLLKYKGPDRSLMRQLQRYAVNIYVEQFNTLLMRGSIEAVQPEIYAMTSEIEYDHTLGLMVEDIVFDPTDLII
jgi:CRISPR-associated endonuclease/helicase Cas3